MGKLWWMVPIGQHSENNWEIIANPALNSYTKTRNHRKTLRKTQKTTIYWTQKNSKHQNKSYVGARFLHLAWQGGGAVRQLCHWSGAFQTWTATSSFDRVTRRNRYDSANAGTQDSWHVAWPTVILRFTRMETRWKTLALSPRKLNETKFRE